MQESPEKAKNAFEYMRINKMKMLVNLLHNSKEKNKRSYRIQALTMLNLIIKSILPECMSVSKKKKTISSTRILSNITNTMEIHKSKAEFPKLPAPIKNFDAPDGIELIQNDNILKSLAESSSKFGPDERSLFLSILSGLCKLAHAFKKRQIYDALADRLLHYGVYSVILNSCESMPILTEEEEENAVNAFELAATSPSGVFQLSSHLTVVLEILRKALNKQFGKQENEKFEFSAVTVLLDLTANEGCLEKVAKFLMEHSMYGRIFEELQLMLQRCSAPKAEKLCRYKDLLIGIILNLACNVESEEIQQHFVSTGVISLLITVLFDSRNDWPSNGSALALLQYCHMSLGNLHVYQKVREAEAQKRMEEYMNYPGSQEAKKNIYEALSLICVAEEKQHSVLEILNRIVIAPAA